MAKQIDFYSIKKMLGFIKQIEHIQV